MVDEIHHPHDLLVRAVLSDVAEAVSLLQAHLPDEVSRELNWATLRLAEGSFVDDDLRGSEADLLYEAQWGSEGESLWIYILFEHQSTPDRWMRFRLLKYCCRIWGVNLVQRPAPGELRPILPVVFYQGERRWTYSREFGDLFAESVRDWPWVPRFPHELIDQSGLCPEEVQGGLKEQLMQLLLMAAYHPTLSWMPQVARLLGSLSSLELSGSMNYVRLFMLYILETQEPEAAQSFREVLRQHAPVLGDELMTYAQELRAEGRLRNQVEVIEGLLREGVAWSVIERATGVSEAQFQTLKGQLEELNE